VNPPDSLSRKELRKWEKSHNIIDLSDQLSIKLFTINKTNKVTHHDGVTNRDIIYTPNEIANIGIGIGYKWIGLDIVFSSPSKDDHVFGTTKRFDLQSSIYMHKFVIDAAYQRYKGYYNSNPASYDSNFDKNNPIYPIRPDVKTKSLSLSGLYIFNHNKFSHRHAFTFNEIQKRSMGSFLAGAYFNTYTLNADSTLIPYQLKNEVDTTADFRGTKYVNFGVAVGYAYNLILIKRLYISGSLALGIGPTFQNTPKRNNQPAKQTVGTTPFVSPRVGIGYNGQKWFAGISVQGITTGSGDEGESFIVREFSSIRVHIGLRIKPPDVLKKLL